MNTELLHVQPSELKFACSQVQSNKLSTCWLQLTNITDGNVAFKVKTTHPKKYSVRPNAGIVSSGSFLVIRVSMQAQKESVLDSVPKDKFLIQSMIAPAGLKDLTPEMFRKERGNNLKEHMLRVVYVMANPPSPIAETSEEEYSPEESEQEKSKRQDRFSTLFDMESAKSGNFQDQFSEGVTIAGDFEDQFSEASAYALEYEDQPSPRSQEWEFVSKLAEDKSFVATENQELQIELAIVRKQVKKRGHHNTYSVLVLLIACFLGFALGYMFK